MKTSSILAMFDKETYEQVSTIFIYCMHTDIVSETTKKVELETSMNEMPFPKELPTKKNC